MVARNGHHTYATKPTGYGTRPHPLTFHIHNRITLLVLYAYLTLSHSLPATHAQGRSMRGTVFAGWGAGGRELTREIIVPAPQARRPTLRRPFDAPQPQAIHQPRGADSYDGVREEETSAEVRGVAQDREGGRGRRGRGWVARVAVGLARAAFLVVYLLWRCLGL